MATLEQLRSTRRDEILDLASYHGVGNVRVFGSVARGDSDAASDLDLLVDPAPGTSLLDLFRLREALETLLGCKVDVVSARGMRPRVRETVLKDAVVL